MEHEFLQCNEAGWIPFTQKNSQVIGRISSPPHSLHSSTIWKIGWPGDQSPPVVVVQLPENPMERYVSGHQAYKSFSFIPKKHNFSKLMKIVNYRTWKPQSSAFFSNPQFSGTILVARACLNGFKRHCDTPNSWHRCQMFRQSSSWTADLPPPPPKNQALLGAD